jgi:O-antigen/teichoic acid export membrane protein
MVLLLLSAVGILTCLNAAVGQALLAAGRIWYGLVFNIAWSIILLVLAYSFISAGFGANGLALALLIAYFFHTVVQFIFVEFWL